MSDVVIYHNPACSASRNTLALLKKKGIEPKVVEYLKVGWTEPQLKGLLETMGVSARDVLRQRGAEVEALSLTDPQTSEAAILKAMIKDPVLVNRPIVVTAKGAALCRPPERVLDLL